MIFLFLAFLTVIVETLVWVCFKNFRNWRFLIWCAAVNIWSNLTLNLLLRFIWRKGDTLLSAKVLIGEVIVVLAEFLLFYAFEKKCAGRLFMLTLAANIISFSLSFII